MSKMTVFVNGQEVAFTSPYSDFDALTKLWNSNPTNPFAKSLLAQSMCRQLSSKQMVWVHKLVVDFEEEVRKVVASVVKNMLARVITKAIEDEENRKLYEAEQKNKALLDSLPSFENIISRLNSAAKVLKTPKIVFKLAELEVRFNRYSDTYTTVKVGTSSTSGTFGTLSGTFGTIGPNNRLKMSNITEEICEVLAEIAKDPVTFAKKYGLGTGICCFCSRPLCDDRTLAVGYGKVCADNWGLPWGSKRIRVKNVIAAPGEDI